MIKLILTEDAYSQFSKNKKYASSGEEVELVSDVVIVKNKKGESFPVKIKKLKDASKN